MNSYYVKHILHKKKAAACWELTTAFFNMETSVNLVFIFEFQKFYVSFIIYFKVFSTIIA